jgi:L-rhamnose-H+ transport protein
MNGDAWLGLLVIVVSGIAIGTSPWPIKCMKRFEYEHWAFVAMFSGLLAGPWLVTVLACPNALGAFRSVGLPVLVKANLFSLSWGIGNILYLLCLLRIGVSLANGILAGVGVSLGVITPMIFKGTGVFSNAPELSSPAGWTILGGVAVMQCGVVLISLAGLGRQGLQGDQSGSGSRFLVGLLMAITAAALSVGFSFAFVYSQGPILEAMAVRGAGDAAANVSVWAAGLLAGVLLNVAYPAYLMTKHRSWERLWRNPREVALAATFWLMFFAGLAMMGKGMLLMGSLGASVGFGVQQTIQMLGGQTVGFCSGEWRGTHGKPRVQLYCGILVLLLAAIIMSLGNAIRAQ